MSLLNNALSGALAAQIGLDVTSQNVSNMATDGYTRQGAIFSSVQPTRTGKVAAGDGVTVNSLIRFSDNYKSQQMWRANSELGQRDVGQPYLTQLEQVMGDDSANLDAGLDEFFGALNSATVDP
ncbi:MAG: flagellar hook-associated protein FlgK, partial [Rhizobacter sp.]|nr:flagellar hook-associated protein FlgK [Rhizobacter sp.]